MTVRLQCGLVSGFDASHAELIAIAQRSPWFMEALSAVQSLGLRSWCIGAGAVRNLVWDHLHGYPVPSKLADIDAAFFDPAQPPERDAQLQRALAALAPQHP